MRIAVNTLAVVPGVTISAETYTSSLVRSLLEVDSQNEYILIVRKDNRHVFPKEGKGVTHYVSSLKAGSRVGRAFWEQFILPWVCKSQSIDLLIIPTGVGPVRVPCPTIVVVTLMQAFHMPESLPPIQRAYYRWFHAFSLRAATWVIALSEQGRQDIQKYIGLDRGKVEVVYPGVSGEFRPVSQDGDFKPVVELEKARDYILAVGPVQSYKNLDLLIRAFEKVRVKGLPHHLLITSGGQPIPSHLKRLAEENGSGRIRFVEHLLTRTELVSLYSGARVFVHPSSCEQFSLTVVEAMACGAPVIASAVPSILEQVGDAGIIVRIENEEALVEAMLRVLTQPELQKEMSRRSLERSQLFSWDTAAHKMIAILEKVSCELA